MKIPEFAILGHPNEGKSTVVSTLSENDSVRISRIPGETVICRSFPVSIDDNEILKFTDTPGFQIPRKTLKWFKKYTGPHDDIIKTFISEHKDNVIFRDECELLKPVERGAGIIYVVDGSRPVRMEDKAEMEILRLTGKPRMAIINCKIQDQDYTSDWKNEFRKSFNSVRLFNAAQATYSQRISLLSSLKSIDQDWENILDQVIDAYKNEWIKRNRKISLIMSSFLSDSLTLHLSGNYTKESEEHIQKEKLTNKYKDKLKKSESKTLDEIRFLFKHTLYKPSLPDQSILHKDLFNKKNWQVLGLSFKQLIPTGAACGGAAGAAIDVALAGHSLGLFTAAGGLLGIGSAVLGGKKMAKTKIYGQKLGGFKIKVGPNENIQFMYVLIDRLLIYYSYLITRAHGKRESNKCEKSLTTHQTRSFSSEFTQAQRKTCNKFFLSLKKSVIGKNTEKIRESFEEMLYDFLIKMSD